LPTEPMLLAMLHRYQNTPATRPPPRQPPQEMGDIEAVVSVVSG